MKYMWCERHYFSAHVHHQQTFVDNLQRLGNNECNKSVHDTDPDIGSAFLRLSCYMRSVFNLFQNLVILFVI